MAGKLLLDTNAIIALFSGDKQVSARLAEAEAFVPSTALGELYYGARKSSRSLQNVAKIEEFAAASQVIACDAVTAWIYGETKNRLHSKGRPIPENDLWIAAVAIQHGLTLVTRDNHFDDVDNLRHENW